MSACSMHWTTALKQGKTTKGTFSDTVSFELNHGMIIVPISINNKAYRFLFDSGAPFSISNELQNSLNYPKVSKGHIVDSDRNRKKVSYVSVDSILIGNQSFKEQTAFVTDFDSNPFISCLNIDGIIGSNLIRHCNWTINYSEQSMVLSHLGNTTNFDSTAIKVPFKTDEQFNLLVDLKVGQSTVRNVTVDYGSNGSLALPSSTYKVLQEHNELGKEFRQYGFAQSGIVGKTISINRLISYSNKVSIGELKLDSILLKSSNSGLIGSQILSKYIVTIDWQNRNLAFSPAISYTNYLETTGLKIGYSIDNGLYILSITESSEAEKAGLKPGDSILQIDSLDFSSGLDLCDFMEYSKERKPNIDLVISYKDSSRRSVHLEKSILN